MTIHHLSISAMELTITTNVSSPSGRNSSQHYGALKFCSSYWDIIPPPAIMINGDFFTPWQIVCGATWWLCAVSGEMERQRSTAGQADGVSCADLWWLSLWPCLSRIKFLKCKLSHMNSSGGWHTGLSLSLFICQFSLHLCACARTTSGFLSILSFSFLLLLVTLRLPLAVP